MNSDNRKEVDFVLVRTMTPREVVRLLLDRFPQDRNLVCPDYAPSDDPFGAYDRFARLVIERSGDSTFIQLVALFIDELAMSKDWLVDNVLRASLLEGIANNGKVARIISRHLSPHSRNILHQVESDFYGRHQMDDESPGKSNLM